MSPGRFPSHPNKATGNTKHPFIPAAKQLIKCYSAHKLQKKLATPRRAEETPRPPSYNNTVLLMRITSRFPVVCALTLCFTAAAHAQSNPFSIQINYSGDAAYQSTFSRAKTFWEGVITGYQNGNLVGRMNLETSSFIPTLGPVSQLVIDATFTAIDGQGGVGGQASPTVVGYDASGYVLATRGKMEFDTADFGSLSTGEIDSVVRHEMGHVLGIGTLWQINGLYDPTSAGAVDPLTGETVGQYTGSAALNAYRIEFGQPSIGYVPVEKGGSAGTTDAHWDEMNDQGVSATGRISSISGMDFRHEMMTGWLTDPTFLSNVSRGSLEDLGYTVNYLPVPEPSSALLLGLGFLSLALQRRK